MFCQAIAVSITLSVIFEIMEGDMSTPYSSSISDLILSTDMPLAYKPITFLSNSLHTVSYFFTILGSNSAFLSLGISTAISPKLVLIFFEL